MKKRAANKPARRPGESVKDYLKRIRPAGFQERSQAHPRRRVGAAFEQPIKTEEDKEIARLKSVEFRLNWSNGGTR